MAGRDMDIDGTYPCRARSETPRCVFHLPPCRVGNEPQTGTSPADHPPLKVSGSFARGALATSLQERFTGYRLLCGPDERPEPVTRSQVGHHRRFRLDTS